MELRKFVESKLLLPAKHVLGEDNSMPVKWSQDEAWNYGYDVSAEGASYLEFNVFPGCKVGILSSPNDGTEDYSTDLSEIDLWVDEDGDSTDTADIIFTREGKALSDDDMMKIRSELDGAKSLKDVESTIVTNWGFSKLGA